MIRDISNLSDEHKIYMLYNSKCFSPSVVAKIRFNRPEWEETVGVTLSEDKKRILENTIVTLRNNFLAKTKPNEKIPEEKIGSLFITLSSDRVIMESDETIYDFMSVCLTHIKRIKKQCNPSNDELGRVFSAIYDVIIPWKITANIIKKKCDADVRPTDENLFNFSTKINSILFKEMTSRQDEFASAIVIYNLLTSLGLTLDDKAAVEFLLMTKEYVCKESSGKILDNLKKLFKNDNAALNIIDKVGIDTLGGFGEMILNFSKRKIEDNYKKTKVSEEVGSNTLIIGNDVFDNAETNLSDIIIDLDKLNEEEIKRYVGKEKVISYFLDERENGFLRKEEELPLCKVLRKGMGFITVIRFDDKQYLMFKIQGNPNLFGISFPPGPEGNRMLTKFEVPKRYDYKMIM